MDSNDMKFYGLQKDRPEDRHRWFFGPEEAYNFIEYRARLAGFRIEQFDCLTYQPGFFEKYSSAVFSLPSLRKPY